MTFKQRFLRYLVGFGIGSAIVFFMFPNYDWMGWTPRKRIMENIREGQFSFEEKSNCQMACLSLTSEQIQKARNEGVVDFEKSNVKSIPVVYHLDYDQLELKVALTDSTVVLKEIQRKGQYCECP